MGIGMQIVYLGFTGSAAIEAEADTQRHRLDRFEPVLAGCHIAIERLRRSAARRPMYDVRFDLISDARVLQPIGHCESDDPRQAVRDVFDTAARTLLQFGDGQ